MKKLRSLRSLRHNLVFIANKTPLASLAPSKFVSLLIRQAQHSLREPRCIACCIYVHHACCMPLYLLVEAMQEVCRSSSVRAPLTQRLPMEVS